MTLAYLVTKTCLKLLKIITRSFVLYACFVDRCLSFCTCSFGHCVVYSSSIYWFWLPLWYLQTLLIRNFALQLCVTMSEPGEGYFRDSVNFVTMPFYMLLIIKPMRYIWLNANYPIFLCKYLFCCANESYILIIIIVKECLNLWGQFNYWRKRFYRYQYTYMYTNIWWSRREIQMR